MAWMLLELERYPGSTRLGADLATARSPPYPCVSPYPILSVSQDAVGQFVWGGGWGLRGGRAGRLRARVVGAGRTLPGEQPVFFNTVRLGNLHCVWTGADGVCEGCAD